MPRVEKHCLRALLPLLWCSLCLHANETSEHSNSYALARVRKSGVEDQLVTIFAKFFYPSLVKYVSFSSGEGQTANDHFENTSFSLDSIREEQIIMAIRPHPFYPSTKVRITATAHFLTGYFSNVSALEFSLLDSSVSDVCAPCQMNVLTQIGNLSMALDFGLEEDNQTIAFIPQEAFHLSEVSLDVECACAFENSRRRHGDKIESSLKELTTKLQTIIESRVSNFFLNHVGVRKTSISRIPPIKSHLGSIQTDLDIEAFMVDGDDVVLKGGAIFTSTLLKPQWRQGRSITTKATNLVSKLNDKEGKLVSCSLGASGLNALAESAWYMSWSEAQPTSLDPSSSHLCIPSPNDPCPFPPMVTKSNTAINIALIAFFLPSGIFTEFTIFLLVPPPEFIFHENPNTISGTTAAQVYIDGTSRWSRREVRLASITMPISVTATIPTYDAYSGYFHSLRIEEVNLGKPIIQFTRQSYINNIIQFPFQFAESTANAKLKELVIPDVNRNIEQALSNMPLYINPLKNVPRKGLSLHFHLESVKTSAVGRSLEGNDSYLTLDADLTLKVFENIPLCLMLDNNGDSSEVFDSFRTSS